jgi:hypothetical protein
MQKSAARYLAKLEKISGVNLYFVLADLDGTASVALANPIKPGAGGDAPIQGMAWFLMTKTRS